MSFGRDVSDMNDRQTVQTGYKNCMESTIKTEVWIYKIFFYICRANCIDYKLQQDNTINQNKFNLPNFILWKK